MKFSAFGTHGCLKAGCILLVQGKKGTAFPAMCNKLSEQSFIDNRVVVDYNLITSRGPVTSMEFAIGIV